MQIVKRARAPKNRALGKINHQKTFTLPGPIIQGVKNRAAETNESESFVAAKILAEGLGLNYQESLRAMDPWAAAGQ